ncbi:hypothetical protein GH5_04290 [Leishmania sp. Ghana 2012 LV757]|uniref:hypothetical protein n=1 Tax=Leishmania sp. Ghana 2012 LV757 TaxID=2803181 RepID=UPI001B409A01|nr:hypothetical protein GH5_04290 [Leishmania sp. Ghana 2012 LV757]
MTDRAEMESMLVSAPIGAFNESLVSILCVEVTPKTQLVLDKELSAVAAGDFGNKRAAARAALRQLPGTHLRMSPSTTIRAIRFFLQEQEATGSSSSSGRRSGADAKQLQNHKSLAHAHFFAVCVPSVSSEKVDATDVFLPLDNTATLQDVLTSGAVLLGADDADANATEQTLLLVYMRESGYGFDAGDLLCCALCAGICACCIALCASGARSAAGHREKNEYGQQQYPGNTIAQPQGQPYYQGNAPGGPSHSYGAPPQPYPNGYPVAQPAYYNYAGGTEYAQQPPPPPQYYYAQPPDPQPGCNYQNPPNGAAPL